MAKTAVVDIEASNTISTTRNDLESSQFNSVQFSGSEDYLEASLYVDWGEVPNQCWAATTLGKHRQAAEVTDKRFVVTEFKGRMIEVKGHGKRGPAIHYDAVCQYKGITFELAFRPQRKGKPNVSVSAKSLASMSMGVFEFMSQVESFIADLGGRFIAGTWKRIDLAVDFAGLGVDQFCRHYQSGQYVSRSHDGAVRSLRKKTKPVPGSCDPDDDDDDDDEEDGVEVVRFSRKQYTGVEHGLGIKLRIYDKMLEATGKKADPEKLAYLQANRFKGQGVCTRVEFQLRGKTLRAVGLEKWSKTVEMREQIATWLVTKWFRFADVTSRSNSNRAHVLPIWQLVQRAFGEVFGKTDVRPKRIKARPGQMRRLVLQAFGLVSSIGACLSSVNGVAPTWDEVVTQIRNEVPDDFAAVVDVKRVTRGADLSRIMRGPTIHDDLDADVS